MIVGFCALLRGSQQNDGALSFFDKNPKNTLIRDITRKAQESEKCPVDEEAGSKLVSWISLATFFVEAAYKIINKGEIIEPVPLLNIASNIEYLKLIKHKKEFKYHLLKKIGTITMAKKYCNFRSKKGYSTLRR